jgi:hypothetical protein
VMQQRPVDADVKMHADNSFNSVSPQGAEWITGRTRDSNLLRAVFRVGDFKTATLLVAGLGYSKSSLVRRGKMERGGLG